MTHLDDRIELKKFADMLYNPTLSLSIPNTLHACIKKEYDKTISMI